jgi:hypothetical protein
MYREPGVYYDSLLTKDGCDSVYKLELIQARNYVIEEYDSICQGEIYTWHGNSYAQSGTYTDKLSSQDGCDSTHILHLHVNKSYHFVEENGIRNSGSFAWRGRTLTQPGQYFDSLSTEAGCDSIYQLNLKYVRSYYYPRSAYICTGKTYTWRGHVYTEGGVYYDSLKSVTGADSVYQLHLIVAEPFLLIEDVAICSGESYSWHGETYTQTGTYYDSNISMAGCDSTYQLNLTVGVPFSEITDASICADESYMWRGFEYNKPGVYREEYTTKEGCDSVYQLNLTQNKTYHYIHSHTMCRGEYYQWRGKRYTETGIYWDSLHSVHGCDSVYQLSLQVNEPFMHEEQARICDNEIYYWRGKQLTTSGVYYDSLMSSHGCDSIYVLILDVKPTYHSKIQATICENETFTWRGRSYNETDTYYEYLTSQDGCDSTFSL